jgi:hypothetical protein
MRNFKSFLLIRPTIFLYYGLWRPEIRDGVVIDDTYSRVRIKYKQLIGYHYDYEHEYGFMSAEAYMEIYSELYLLMNDLFDLSMAKASLACTIIRYKDYILFTITELDRIEFTEQTIEGKYGIYEYAVSTAVGEKKYCSVAVYEKDKDV